MAERLLFSRLERELELRVREFEGVAAIEVRDLATGKVMSVNREVLMSVGSSIKIPVLAAFYLKAARGKIDPQEMFCVEKRHHTGGSGILQQFDHAAHICLEDIATLMITLSDNSATNILIDLIGFESVNRLLSEHGLTRTVLARRMIDNEAAVHGKENVSTAEEAAQLMEMLYRGTFADADVCDKVLRVLKKPKQTPVARYLPQGLELATKTGALDGVRSEWAIVYQERRPYVFTCITNYCVADSADEFIAQVSREVYTCFSVLNTSTEFGRRLPLECFHHETQNTR